MAAEAESAIGPDVLSAGRGRYCLSDAESLGNLLWDQGKLRPREGWVSFVRQLGEKAE